MEKENILFIEKKTNEEGKGGNIWRRKLVVTPTNQLTDRQGEYSAIFLFED